MRDRSPEAVARAFFADEMPRIRQFRDGRHEARLAELLRGRDQERAERAAFRRIVRAVSRCDAVDVQWACDRILAALDAKPTKEPRRG